MAGTRGLSQFRGEQLNAKIMRDRHFDEQNKINEKYIDIDWHSHRESLEDTKVDVWTQINDVAVGGLGSVTLAALDGRTESTGLDVEGIVTDKKVEVRLAGTEDTSEKDTDADRVYGRLVNTDGTYTLNFYSIVDDTETAYTFAEGETKVDVRYVLRTNLAVIPVDAILNGGSGFVEGATDAQAYMNILQLAKDIYGVAASLDNDGNPNLPKDLVTQIAELANALEAAIKELRDELASEDGAGLIGVLTDDHYAGTTVQAVLSELARFIFILQTEEQEEVYEAVGGETGYTFVNGLARPGTVMIFINGALQAPGINFAYAMDVDNPTLIKGIDFTPDTLKITEGVPDVLFIKYKKHITP